MIHYAFHSTGARDVPVGRIASHAARRGATAPANKEQKVRRECARRAGAIYTLTYEQETRVLHTTAHTNYITHCARIIAAHRPLPRSRIIPSQAREHRTRDPYLLAVTVKSQEELVWIERQLESMEQLLLIDFREDHMVFRAVATQRAEGGGGAPWAVETDTHTIKELRQLAVMTGRAVNESAAQARVNDKRLQMSRDKRRASIGSPTHDAEQPNVTDAKLLSRMHAERRDALQRASRVAEAAQETKVRCIQCMIVDCLHIMVTTVAQEKRELRY